MAEKSEFSCPTCKATTGQLNQVYAAGGYLRCSMNPEHKWNDTKLFLDLKPTMDFKVAPAKFPPQEGHEKITLSIPSRMKQQLEEKFGSKLSATVAAQMAILLEGDGMIVAKTELDRMRQKLGWKPQSGSELFGLIWALSEEVEEQRLIALNAVRDAQAYQGISPGRVVVDLGDQVQTATARAQDENVPLALWLAERVHTALANNWF